MMFINQYGAGDSSTVKGTSGLHSYGGTNDQHSYSQFELSQISSQDLYSQQMSGNSQHSNERPVYFQKFLVKPTEHQNQSSNLLGVDSTSLMDRKGGLRERDDRDILLNIINIVKDCSNEVNKTFDQVKDVISRQNESDNNLFTTLVEKVKHLMDENFGSLLEELKKSDDRQKQLTEIKQIIEKKDQKIEKLEEDNCTLRKENSEKIMDSLKESYAEQQQLNREQIHRYHQLQLQELKAQTDIQKSRHVESEKQAAKYRQYVELQHRQQLAETMERIDKELSRFQRYQENKRQEFQKQCEGQLKHLHHHQQNDLKNQLEEKLINTQGDQCIKIQEEFQHHMKILQDQQKKEFDQLLREWVKKEMNQQKYCHQQDLKNLMSMQQDELTKMKSELAMVNSTLQSEISDLKYKETNCHQEDTQLAKGTCQIQNRNSFAEEVEPLKVENQIEQIRLKNGCLSLEDDENIHSKCKDSGNFNGKLDFSDESNKVYHHVGSKSEDKYFSGNWRLKMKNLENELHNESSTKSVGLLHKNEMENTPKTFPIMRSREYGNSSQGFSGENSWQFDSVVNEKGAASATPTTYKKHSIKSQSTEINYTTNSLEVEPMYALNEIENCSRIMNNKLSIIGNESSGPLRDTKIGTSNDKWWDVVRTKKNPSKTLRSEFFTPLQTVIDKNPCYSDDVTAINGHCSQKSPRVHSCRTMRRTLSYTSGSEGLSTTAQVEPDQHNRTAGWLFSPISNRSLWVTKPYNNITKPSPVATVYPLIQTKNQNSSRLMDIGTDEEIQIPDERNVISSLVNNGSIIDSEEDNEASSNLSSPCLSLTEVIKRKVKFKCKTPDITRMHNNSECLVDFNKDPVRYQEEKQLQLQTSMVEPGRHKGKRRRLNSKCDAMMLTRSSARYKSRNQMQI